MNEKLNIAICDDEKSWLEGATQVLQSYASDVGPNLSIETYSSGGEMLRDAKSVPDLLFCDIELGESRGGGIDLVEKIAQRWPACQVVYVTNFLRYAPDVYATEHLWFALKEQFEDRLPEIFTKYMRLSEEKNAVLAVTTIGKELLSLPCEDILCLERRGRITTITVRDGLGFLVPDRLPDLLERLPHRSFARCHGSYAVNLAHVRVVERDTIILVDDVSVPLSRRLSRGFRDRYLDWVGDHAV